MTPHYLHPSQAWQVAGVLESIFFLNPSYPFCLLAFRLALEFYFHMNQKPIVIESLYETYSTRAEATTHSRRSSSTSTLRLHPDRT